MSRHPADSATSTAWKLEQNLGAYIGATLRAMRLKHQVLSSNDFAERLESVIVEIDATSDLATVEMGIMQTSTLAIHVFGQIDEVKSKSHKDIVARIYASLFCVPKPAERMLTAHPQCLAALNRSPGRTDRRAQSGIHVWDLREPSSSLGAADATADTIILCKADFSPSDWDGAEPYGQ